MVANKWAAPVSVSEEEEDPASEAAAAETASRKEPRAATSGRTQSPPLNGHSVGRPNYLDLGPS